LQRAEKIELEGPGVPDPAEDFLKVFVGECFSLLSFLRQVGHCTENYMYQTERLM
jgi:hypothetical protein